MTLDAAAIKLDPKYVVAASSHHVFRVGLIASIKSH